MLTGDTAGHTLPAEVRARVSGALGGAGWPLPGWGPRALWATGRSQLVPSKDGKSRTGGCPYRAIYSHRLQVEGPVPGALSQAGQRDPGVDWAWGYASTYGG